MTARRPETVRIFLVGDVMLGRGIDQILAHSCDPVLYEGDGGTALEYVVIAEAQNGKLPPRSTRTVDYVWGYATEVLERMRPDVRVINLETAVTTCGDHWPDKLVTYRMHPGNTEVIQAAGIDCCVLANNHVLDWGYGGLQETLKTLHCNGIATVGAGRSAAEACAPAQFVLPKKSSRILVFAAGDYSAGVYPEWQVTDDSPGVYVINIYLPETIQRLSTLIQLHRKPGDLVILSLHWGSNWGWDIPPYHREFAHKAIDLAGVDIIYGHSSHHVKGLEVYNGKLILYGCGDFINDYEGIGSHPELRGDLSLMYFVDLDVATGKLVSLTMVPSKIHQLRVTKPSLADTQWICQTMIKECEKLNTVVTQSDDQLLVTL